MTTTNTPLVTAQSVFDSIDFSERDAFNPATELPAGAIRQLLLTVLAISAISLAVTAAGLLTTTSALTFAGTAGLLGALFFGGSRAIQLFDLD
ncbi:Uncharacterised protein [Actinomyces bovis]|uniref:Uncharacterized protein n=1 Tax=Actinomyces bovis TaxID=1658 RepID=A0ABY1VM50_9ACTO|nr:hypothetical protein [Actinomyces bovis]SPT52822.1 Uncharacterised protein [Actinomyces bovis]VEG54883.1 Uncharacterised protein [Actinomyces israelii]